MKIKTNDFKIKLYNTMQFIVSKNTIESATMLSFKSDGKILKIEVLGPDGLTTSFLQIKDKDIFDFYISEVGNFNKMMGTINSEEFELIVNENSILIKDEFKEFKIGTTNIDSIDYKKHNIKYTAENINFEELKQVLTTANKFTADDELRPVLNGVNINKKHIVGTDSHFLYVMNNSTFKDIEDSIIISRKFISKLSKIKLDEFVNIYISDKTITISSTSFQTSSRLIDGDYPNYMGIVGEFKHSLVVDKIDFNNTIKEASIIDVKLLKFTVKDDSITINADNVDYNQNYTRTIKLADKKGEDIIIGFNKDKVNASIDNFNSNEIVIEYNTEATATKIHAIEEEDNNNEFIILMPMMINV